MDVELLLHADRVLARSAPGPAAEAERDSEGVLVAHLDRLQIVDELEAARSLAELLNHLAQVAQDQVAVMSLELGARELEAQQELLGLDARVAEGELDFELLPELGFEALLEFVFDSVDLLLELVELAFDVVETKPLGHRPGHLLMLVFEPVEAGGLRQLGQEALDLRPGRAEPSDQVCPD